MLLSKLLFRRTLVAAIACAAGHGAAVASPAADKEADARAIAAEASDLASAWAAKSPDRVIGHFADDATAMEPDVAVTGKPAMKKFIEEAVKDPGFSMEIVTRKVEAGTPGPLGYVRGTFKVRYTNKETAKVDESAGNFIAVFRKQADGRWKIVEDISTPGALQ